MGAVAGVPPHHPSHNVRRKQAMPPTRMPAAVAALATLLPLAPLQAMTVVWDGGGPSANWSALDSKPGPSFGRTNWSGTNVFPNVGDALVFGGNTRLTNNNDIAALSSITSLTFAADAGAFTLNGNGLALSGAITNLSKARQTINLPLTVSGTNLSWDGGSAGVAVNGGFVLGDRALSLNRNIAISAVSSQLIVGDQAQGALTIAGGSTVDVAGAVVGQRSPGSGNLVVDGAASRLSAPSRLTVGTGGFGALSIGNGGRVTTGTLTAGGDGPSAGSGRILVAGAGSTLAAGVMQLGGTGTAQLAVSGGALLTSASASLSGPRSELVFSGAGTTWHNQGVLAASFGSKLRIDSGAAIDSGSISIGTGGAADATVTGAGTRLSTVGSLTLGSGSHIGLSDGATLESASATLAGMSAGVFVQGGAHWNAGSLLQIGDTDSSTASLQISGGGVVGAAAVSVGTSGSVILTGGTLQTDSFAVRGGFNWTGGTLHLTTPGSAVLGGSGMPWPAALTMVSGTTLQVTNELVLGATALHVQSGALVTAARTTIGAGSLFELAGGTLQTDTLAGPGPFNWNAGTLRLTAAGGAALGSGPLARVMTLSGAQRLDVTHDLFVGSGALLVLDGGRASAGRLVLGGGSVVGLQPLDLADYGVVRGHGSMVAALHGGAATVIQADGPLTLGDLASAQGFAFDGRLEVGAAQVLLLSQTPATPGTIVTIGAGGQLASVNGLWLAAGRTLGFDGSASVLGGFVNDGHVGGSAGTLTFLNDVSGSGSFAGDVVFHAGFSPGHSAARVDFGGGDAAFDSSAVLTIELFGAAAGSGHDQLANIDRLSFDGRLRLAFGNGYTPAAGTRFALFDFDSFGGSLAPERIDVSGFDRHRLDFSHLAIDGTLGVSAVPEPSTWAMWLAALAFSASLGRLRRRPQ
jgi:T5SS/PEP-CTERM-associated repeat protein